MCEPGTREGSSNPLVSLVDGQKELVSPRQGMDSEQTQGNEDGWMGG